MKTLWQPAKRLFAGLRCIEHQLTKELCLVGKYGEIWIHNESTFKAVIYSHRIIKRFLPRERWSVDALDEVIIDFESQELNTWVDRLLVPAKPYTQAEIANRTKKVEFAKSNMVAASSEILSLGIQNQSQNHGSNDSLPPTDERFDLIPGTKNPNDSAVGASAAAFGDGGDH
jgi:hypothetical protein